MTEYEQLMADNADANFMERARLVDQVVEELKASPGIFVITEMAPSRLFKQKWQRRGCVTRVQRTDEGKYAIYVMWPRPDEL